MNDLFEFTEFINYAKRFREEGPRRYLRDHSDPFTKYSAQEFRARYRFSPQVVKSILVPMLKDLRTLSKRGLPFAPEIMILLTLRFYATGSFQKMDGDTMNICQQSASRIIARVSTVIASQMKYRVKFHSTTEEINSVKQKFYEIAQFPDVIGCIDCTHIKVKNPGGTSSEAYRNREGYFSIKVQAVTGPNMEFYDLVARWPGGTHDGFIYNNSALKQKLNTGVLLGVLLGDNKYTVSNVLMTPFLSPDSPAQENFNKSHIETRKSIENCFEVWKRRFPCLQVGMGIKIDTVVAVICACATLHNIAISIGDILPLERDSNNINVVNIDSVTEDPSSDGYIFRQSLVDRFFSQQAVSKLFCCS